MTEKNYYQKQLMEIRAKHFPPQPVIDRVVKARRYIDGNFRYALSLDQMAESGHLSKFHFIRLFKKCYGRTPHQYLTEKRIALAKELLKTQLSVVETCNEVGFESSASFSILFKKETGLSPVEYKKSNIR